MSNIVAGRRVALLTDKDECESILECYGPGPFPPASHLVGRVAVVQATPHILSDGWDGLVDLRLSSSGRSYRLPFAIIDVDRVLPPEEEDEKEEKPAAETSFVFVRDAPSEAAMIKQLAAESIQDAYRRYRACKPHMKLLKISSTEQLVMTFAADTIKATLKEAVLRRKRRKLEDKAGAGAEDKGGAPTARGGPVQPTTLELICNDEADDDNGNNDATAGGNFSMKKGKWTGTAWVLEDLDLRAPAVADDKGPGAAASPLGRKAAREGAASASVSPSPARRLFPDTKAEPGSPSPSRPHPHPRELKGGGDGAKGESPLALAVAGSRFAALSPPPSPSPSQAKGHKAEPSPTSGGRPASTSKASPLRSPVPPAYVLDEDSGGDWDGGAPAVAPGKGAVSPLRVASALPLRDQERDKDRGRERERDSKEFKSKAGLSAALKIAEAQQALRASAAVLGSLGPRAPPPPTAPGTRQYMGDFIANRSEMAAAARAQGGSVPGDRFESKRGAPSSSSSSGPRLVIDEAFWRAMGKCTFVRLLPHEVAMILDALGYKLTDHACYLFSSPKRRAGQVDAQPEDFVNLPLLGSAPLAAALCKTVRRHHFVEHGHVFSISERNAQVALVHLKSLLEGPWRRVRQVVLSACRTRGRHDAPTGPAAADGHRRGAAHDDDHDAGAPEGGPPSRWDPEWVQRLAWEAQFPAEYFSHCPGRDLLAITRKMIKTDFNILPSLLQERFIIYQRALQLLEDWWSLGLRPSDPYKDSFQQLVDGGRFSYEGPHDRLAAQLNGGSSSAPAVSAAAATDSPTAASSSSAAALDRYVEIASSAQLLHEWVPLSRANGWGAPLEVLSAVSGLVGGVCGRILPAVGSSSSGHGGSDLTNQDVSSIGCRWVQVSAVGAGDGDDGGDGPNRIHVEIRDLLHAPLQPAPFVRETPVSLALLVPLSCLSAAPRDVTLGTARRDRSANLGVPVTGLVVGTHVMVVTAEAILQRACERFDWWDRPQPDVLKNMAGRKGEIVSVAELASKKRVGVRILGTNVVDALPVEVLLPCPSATAAAAVLTSAAAMSGSSSQGDVGPGKKTKGKDGVGKKSSTGGAKLREKYAKRKGERRVSSAAAAATEGKEAVPGHGGKMYLYDMPPPPDRATSPGRVDDPQPYARVATATATAGPRASLTSPLGPHPTLATATYTDADDAEPLEAKGVSPARGGGTGRPLYRPRSAPAVAVKLTSESLRQLDLSLQSQPSPHTHQAYFAPDDAVVIPQAMTVNVTRRAGAAPRGEYDEEVAVDDDDDDGEEALPEPDYSWLRGSAARKQDDRPAAEAAAAIAAAAEEEEEEKRKQARAQPTLSYRQHDFAWAAPAPGPAAAGPARRPGAGLIKGRPSSAGALRASGPRGPGLHPDVPDKLPDLGATAADSDYLGLSGLGLGLGHGGGDGGGARRSRGAAQSEMAGDPDAAGADGSRGARPAAPSSPPVQPKATNGVRLRGSSNINSSGSGSGQQAGDGAGRERPPVAAGRRPQSARATGGGASLGELLLRTAAYNAPPIRDAPPRRPPSASATAASRSRPSAALPSGGLPAGADQLARALQDLADDDAREREHFEREMKRTEREEARKERSIARGLGVIGLGAR